MKYLENATLSALSSQITHTSPSCTVQARIEAYTCKATNKDKKLIRAVDEHWEDEIAFKAASPNHPLAGSMLDSPFGSLDQTHARRTFCLLIATLNVAFPDHDFSDVSPDQFTREDNAGVPILSALSNALSAPRDASNIHLTSHAFSAFPATYSGSLSSSPTSSVLQQFHPSSPALANSHPALFRVLNDVVTLEECEVYSYSPDIYSDPHGETDSDTDSFSSSDDGLEWDEYDDDEFNIPSVGRKDTIDPWELSTSPDRDVIFPFDSDEGGSSSKQKRATSASDALPTKSDPIPMAPRARPIDVNYDHQRLRGPKKGGLLWSAHWFFYHKKEKKVLFISLWARQREWQLSSSFGDFGHRMLRTSEPDETYETYEDHDLKDRFGIWEGAEGAGKRAFEAGLRARRPAARSATQ